MTEKTQKKLAASVDMGGTNLRTALLDESLRIIDRHKVSTADFNSPHQLLQGIGDVVREWNRQGYVIQGLCVGAPGPLNCDTGVVNYMPNVPGFANFPFKAELQKQINKPVILFNDADTAAAGEYAAGSAKGCKLFILLTLGTGLGSSVMENGQPWIGPQGISSELGHIPVFGPDEMCSCGGKGHAECRVSTRGIWREYHRLTGHNFAQIENVRPVIDLIKLEQMGDENAAMALDFYGSALGKVIAAAAMTFTVKEYILAGGISRSWNRLKSAAFESVVKYGFSPLTDNLNISVASLGEDAALIGGAYMVFNRRDWKDK